MQETLSTQLPSQFQLFFLGGGGSMDWLKNLNVLQNGFHHISLASISSSYFSAPAQIAANGNIIGHSHFVIEAIQSLTSTALTNPLQFAFFKGQTSIIVTWCSHSSQTIIVLTKFICWCVSRHQHNTPNDQVLMGSSPFSCCFVFHELWKTSRTWSFLCDSSAAVNGVLTVTVPVRNVFFIWVSKPFLRRYMPLDLTDWLYGSPGGSSGGYFPVRCWSNWMICSKKSHFFFFFLFWSHIRVFNHPNAALNTFFFFFWKHDEQVGIHSFCRQSPTSAFNNCATWSFWWWYAPCSSLWSY